MKYVYYNSVRQMYYRSWTLMDRRYILICFMFIRSEFNGFKLQDFRRRDNRLWQYKEYLRRVGSSMSGVYKYYEVTSLLIYLTQLR
jgi:hypothetical protein